MKEQISALEVVKMDIWDQMIWHLTKEVSDEIKKWDSSTGGAAEAIVALAIHVGAGRVNPGQFCAIFYFQKFARPWEIKIDRK